MEKVKGEVDAEIDAIVMVMSAPDRLEDLVQIFVELLGISKPLHLTTQLAQEMINTVIIQRILHLNLKIVLDSETPRLRSNFGSWEDSEFVCNPDIIRTMQRIIPSIWML